MAEVASQLSLCPLIKEGISFQECHVAFSVLMCARIVSTPRFIRVQQSLVEALLGLTGAGQGRDVCGPLAQLKMLSVPISPCMY